MKKSGLLLFILILFSVPLIKTYSQEKAAEKNYIFFAVPEKDTTLTTTSKYRLGGGTLPESRVNNNGKELKVYPSGAFIDLMDLNYGENRFKVTSVSKNGETVTREFIVIRQKPLETTTSDSLVIERTTMLPAKDMWLNDGDVLKVRIKGTPGAKATFLNGLPMRELSPSETGGVKGIYVGEYKVRPGDPRLRQPQTLVQTQPVVGQYKQDSDAKLTDQPVTFVLTDTAGHMVYMESKAKISYKGDEFPLTGITKGDRPYLNFGLGEDRLGGAKMSFINPGIRLKITGKIGNQYKIQLTGNHEAWIPEDQVDIVPGADNSAVLAGSWTVYGDDKYDYVSAYIGEKLPYYTYQDPKDNRIIIDVYGAVSNTNWITQHLSVKEIKNVYYEQPEKEVYRIIIELKHKQLWGYSVSYNGSAMQVKIKRQPKDLDIDKLTFAIDAGHGGANNLGALGSTGYQEKVVNLATAYHLKKFLEDEGAKVIMTRSDDSNINNNERLKTVINANADILISIHSNSIGDASDAEKTKGASTYYKHIAYRPLSMFLYKQVLKTGLDQYGNVGNFNFTLNSPTELPNALVELAFMSNPEDEMKLMDDKFRKELAKKIYKGIEDFLDYCDD